MEIKGIVGTWKCEKGLVRWIARTNLEDKFPYLMIFVDKHGRLVTLCSIDIYGDLNKSPKTIHLKDCTDDQQYTKEIVQLDHTPEYTQNLKIQLDAKGLIIKGNDIVSGKVAYDPNL